MSARIRPDIYDEVRSHHRVTVYNVMYSYRTNGILQSNRNSLEGGLLNDDTASLALSALSWSMPCRLILI